MRNSMLVWMVVRLCAVLCEAGSPKCLAIVFEGGGTKGAYYAGAVKALTDLLPPDKVMYNVSAGVSVGAIAATTMASVEQGKEKDAAKYLEYIWDTIVSTDLFVQWPFPWLFQGFYEKRGFLDSSPMLHYIAKGFRELGGRLRRPISVGVLDIQTMKYVTKDEKMGDEMVPFYVRASCSMPGVFPYVEDGDYYYVDGGTTDNMNVRGAVEKCRQLVDGDDTAIVIDAIMSDPAFIEPADLRKDGTYSVYSRGAEIKGKIKKSWFLRNMIRSFPGINWRYVVIPKEKLPNNLLNLSFNRDNLRREKEMGYKDTKKAIRRGPLNYVDIHSLVDATQPKRKRLT